MPEQALYLKWRPMTFEDVIGQEHVTRTLRNSLKTGRIRHAYLFSGPRGTGKTTTARLLAKAVNCQNENYEIRPCNACPSCIAVNEGRYMDLIEIDAATHTGVDDVRDLREKIAFTPSEGRYKVYIIDEVHRFSGSAFDALLKTLEEPPDHAIFVLATTEIDKVPQTIKSRCLQFEFRRVSLIDVADRLEKIAKNEGLNIERGAVELIARQGTGSVRDSISLLDQIVSDPDEQITLDIAQRILGTANSRAVGELVDALVEGNLPRGLHIINEAIDRGSDPRQFGQQIVEHLRAVMLTQTAGAELVEASNEERSAYQKQAEQIHRSALLRAVRLFNEAVNDYKSGWQPQLALELALIESLRTPEESAGQVVYVQAPATGAQTGHGGAAESAAPIDDEPEVTAETGKPPVVPLSVIREKWDLMLKTLYQIHKTAPDVVQYFRPDRVDGNVVYIVTDHRLYFDRLNGYPEKMRIIEKAFRLTYETPLRVDVEITGTGDDTNKGAVNTSDDPLFSLGKQLGGKINKDKRK